jgi:hypothetical protein
MRWALYLACTRLSQHLVDPQQLLMQLDHPFTPSTSSGLLDGPHCFSTPCNNTTCLRRELVVEPRDLGFIANPPAKNSRSILSSFACRPDACYVIAGAG